MTKRPVPLNVNDVTVFCRALSNQLGDTSPSHLALMNMIARAAGFQNMQHMRAATAAQSRLSQDAEQPIADARTVERTLTQFDTFGRLRNPAPDDDFLRVVDQRSRRVQLSPRGAKTIRRGKSCHQHPESPTPDTLCT